MTNTRLASISLLLLSLAACGAVGGDTLAEANWRVETVAQAELGVRLLLEPDIDCGTFAQEADISSTPRASETVVSEGGAYNNVVQAGCFPPGFELRFDSLLDLIDEAIQIDAAFDGAEVTMTVDDLVVSGDPVRTQATPLEAELDGETANAFLFLDGAFVGNSADLAPGTAYDQLVLVAVELNATLSCSENLACPDRRYVVGVLDFTEEQAL